MKRIIYIFLFFPGVILLSSCGAFLQGLAAGSMMALSGYGTGYGSYGYNPYQTYSPLVMPTNTTSANKEPEVTDRELRIEDDGFRWYKTSGKGSVDGAEDVNHNTIIPLSRGYDIVYYTAKEGHKGYFRVNKGSKWGVCDLTGKEIIQPRDESVFFSTTYEDFEYKSSSGKYVSTGWSLDSNGKGVKISNTSTSSTVSASTTSTPVVSGGYIAPLPMATTPVTTGTSGSSSSSTVGTSSYEPTQYGYVNVDCPQCHHLGTCQTCLGRGYYYSPFGTGTVECPNCDRNHNGKCNMCHGTGQIQRFQRLN